MIPYFDGHLFDVARSLPIHMFGVLVAIGVILGDRIVVAEGAKRGLEAKDVRFLNARIVIGGFIVAHSVSVIFYFPERIKESPWVLLNVWSGLSSFGGFLGALAGFSLLHAQGEDPAPALRRLRRARALASAGSSGAPAASRRTTTPACARVLPRGALPRWPAPRSRPRRAAVHDRHDGDPLRLRTQARAPRPRHRPLRARCTRRCASASISCARSDVGSLPTSATPA